MAARKRSLLLRREGGSPQDESFPSPNISQDARRVDTVVGAVGTILIETTIKAWCADGPPQERDVNTRHRGVPGKIIQFRCAGPGNSRQQTPSR